MSNKKTGPVTELVEKCDRLEYECSGFRDEYTRSLADFDNYRRRALREMENARSAAQVELMSDIIPVLDNFSRAMDAAGPSAPADGIRKGVEMIRQQLCDTLSRRGLVEYSCLGQVFDPRKAEAVSYVESDEHEPHTVVTEQCKGYSCGDLVVRPAKVVVAKPAERNQESEIRDQKSETPEEDVQED